MFTDHHVPVPSSQFPVPSSRDYRTFLKHQARRAVFCAALLVAVISFCGYIPFYNPISTKRVLPQSSPEHSTVTVIPNPATAKTTIRCTSVDTPEVTAEIIDLQGVVVATTTGTPNADHAVELEIDVAKFPAGTYHYRIAAETASIATGSFTVVK